MQTSSLLIKHTHFCFKVSDVLPFPLGKDYRIYGDLQDGHSFVPGDLSALSCTTVPSPPHWLLSFPRRTKLSPAKAFFFLQSAPHPHQACYPPSTAIAITRIHTCSHRSQLSFHFLGTPFPDSQSGCDSSISSFHDTIFLSFKALTSTCIYIFLELFGEPLSSL